MNAHVNLPATLRRLSDIVDEYESKVEAIPATIASLAESVKAADVGSCVGGTFAGTIWGRGGKPHLSEREIRANLLQSAWQHVYNGLNLNHIAPASDRSRFELAFKDPAPFTLDNIRATFGKYIVDPRAHILRGLAECFSQLDPAFKSHDRMKVGVKSLPKRIILNNVTPAGYGGWGTERLRDILNALAVMQGLPHITHGQLSAMLEEAKGGHGRLHEVKPSAGQGAENYGREVLGNVAAGIMGDVWLKRFANGNGHLFFGPNMLATVNAALAEFYGDVLPDCPEVTPKKRTGTDVSKDLQFYRTPDCVADELVSRAYPQEGARILEPSCGDGAILDALRRFGHKQRISLSVVGVEYDKGRAAEAAAKGYAVQVANFLQVAPSPTFDIVVMNPPFYGKHYQKHVDHARKFLKPGGRVLAILPVTAVTDHGYVEPGRGWDKWKDLPVGSFSESGTNINTGIATFGAESDGARR